MCRTLSRVDAQRKNMMSRNLLSLSAIERALASRSAAHFPNQHTHDRFTLRDFFPSTLL